MKKVNVLGVGMTKFTTPQAGIPNTVMARDAVRDALEGGGKVVPIFPEGCFLRATHWTPPVLPSVPGWYGS